MRPQSLLPPFRRSERDGLHGDGMLAVPMTSAAALLAQQGDPPSRRIEAEQRAAESRATSMPVAVISGSSRVVSRVPGAPPRVTPRRRWQYRRRSPSRPRRGLRHVHGRHGRRQIVSRL